MHSSAGRRMVALPALVAALVLTGTKSNASAWTTAYGHVGAADRTLHGAAAASLTTWSDATPAVAGSSRPGYATRAAGPGATATSRRARTDARTR